MGEMYASDERFKEHYEKIAPGCAEFLRDAIKIYCAKQIKPRIHGLGENTDDPGSRVITDTSVTDGFT